MDEKTRLDDQAVRLGYRRAHLAALYANLRAIISASMEKENAAVGFHGVYVKEDTMLYPISSGATPGLPVLLSGMGGLQGIMIENYIARKTGDLTNANIGDNFDPELGKPRCVGCEDGDQDGQHARSELERNALAWLGVVVAVADGFYGEFLPEKVRAMLEELRQHSLPPDTQVR